MTIVAHVSLVRENGHHMNFLHPQLRAQRRLPEVFGAAEAAPASTAEKESSAHSAMRSEAILGVQDGLQ